MLVIFSLITSSSWSTASVDHRHFVYNITCDRTTQIDCEDKSIQAIAHTALRYPLADVLIHLETQAIHLNATVEFTNLTSLIINGETTGSTNIVCSAVGTDSSGAGIIVSNTAMVELNNLRVCFCGSLIIIEHKSFPFMVALAILYCNRVTATEITIEKSNGTGLKIQMKQGDRVSINHSAFIGNKLQVEDTKIDGGCGVHVDIKGTPQQTNGQTVVEFYESLFENNQANNTVYRYIDGHTQNKIHKGYGRGGGVYVLIRSGLDNITVSFLRCKFTNNHAFLGGGLAVDTYGATENLKVMIKDSTFERNGCNHTENPAMDTSTGSGGGAHLTFDTFNVVRQTKITNSHYIVTNTDFIENCAEQGGGVYHFSGKYSEPSNSVSFDNCTFQGNRAHMGSAVILPPSVDRKVISGYSVNVTFKECQFLENHVYASRRREKTAGVGTVYISLSDVHFTDQCYFAHNWGTALYVVNGVVNFQKSSAIFENNTGIQGGAISLIGSSTIVMGPCAYQFINNTAFHQGGAMYISMIDPYDFTNSRNCFVVCLDDEDKLSHSCNVTLSGNRANDITNGHTIYATSLHPCQEVYTDDGTEFMNISDVFLRRGFRFADGTQDELVATDVFKLNAGNHTELMAIPGEKFHHGVIATDSLNHSLNATFWAIIINETSDDFVELDSAFSTLVTNAIKVKGQPRQNASLRLSSISSRQNYIELDLQLLDCPPGFKLDASECVCNSDAYIGIFRCNLHRFQSHLIRGYWTGFVDDKLVTSICPFCDYDRNSYNHNSSGAIVILPRNGSELDMTLCGETRTGIACGKCRKGYTVYFHSPGLLCKKTTTRCTKFGWPFFIVSEILPVTIVFVSVLLLNINFTSGTMNGFILYVQLLNSLDLVAGGIINIPDTSEGVILKYAIAVYRVLYGFYNLDFFNAESLSFCLFENATALDMIAFKYVTILYTMLLIVAVILFVNKCGGQCLGKCCRITAIKTSVIHGISTFLMIGYAKCVYVSLKLLVPMYIYSEINFHSKKRVLLDGELEYLRDKHLPYAILAYVCLLSIGLLPPVVLLFYPLVNKFILWLGLEEHTCTTNISRFLRIGYLKPLFDSFQGSFKDNMRFFAGIYFFYRWMIMLVHILNAHDVRVHYTTVGIMLLVMFTVHAVFQPYLRRSHNIIDALLFCNLLLVNSLSQYTYLMSSAPKLSLKSSQFMLIAIVQLVLIYLPGTILTLYVSLHTIKFFRKNRSWTSTFVRVRKLQSPSSNNDDSCVHERLLDEEGSTSE